MLIHETRLTPLSPVRIYRDELDQIVSILQGAKLAVTLKNRFDKFRNLDELRTARGDAIQSLQIVASSLDEGSDEHIGIHLDQEKGCLLFEGTVGSQADLAWHGVLELLHQHRLPRWRRLFRPMLCIGLALFLVLFRPIRNDWFAIGILAAYCGGGVYYARLLPVIFLVDRKDASLGALLHWRFLSHTPTPSPWPELEHLPR